MSEYDRLKAQKDAILARERLQYTHWWCGLCRLEMGTLANGGPDTEGHGVGECVDNGADDATVADGEA